MGSPDLRGVGAGFSSARRAVEPVDCGVAGSCRVASGFSGAGVAAAGWRWPGRAAPRPDGAGVGHGRLDPGGGRLGIGRRLHSRCRGRLDGRGRSDGGGRVWLGGLALGPAAGGGEQERRPEEDSPLLHDDFLARSPARTLASLSGFRYFRATACSSAAVRLWMRLVDLPPVLERAIEVQPLGQLVGHEVVLGDAGVPAGGVAASWRRPAPAAGTSSRSSLSISSSIAAIALSAFCGAQMAPAKKRPHRSIGPGVDLRERAVGQPLLLAQAIEQARAGAAAQDVVDAAAAPGSRDRRRAPRAGARPPPAPSACRACSTVALVGQRPPCRAGRCARRAWATSSWPSSLLAAGPGSARRSKSPDDRQLGRAGAPQAPVQPGDRRPAWSASDRRCSPARRGDVAHVVLGPREHLLDQRPEPVGHRVLQLLLAGGPASPCAGSPTRRRGRPARAAPRPPASAPPAGSRARS